MWIKRKKDTQKQKVYKAESLFFDRLKDSYSMVFDDMFQDRTLKEIELYCLELIESNWFQKKWPQIKEVKILISKNYGASGVLVGKVAKIKLSKDMKNKFILLHELSHSCDNSKSGWHGSPFCNIFILLIKHKFGDLISDIMKECFEKENVEF